MEVTLAWNARSAPDTAAYRLYQGTAPRSYTMGYREVPAGSTSCTASGLEPGRTYYFAATALTADGMESSFSNEVVYTSPSGRSSTTTSTHAHAILNVPTTTSSVPATTTSILFSSTTSSIPDLQQTTSTSSLSTTTTTPRPAPEDSDGDGISDPDERFYGTDPSMIDTDGDAFGDGSELQYWGAAYNADHDHDGLANLLDADADNDGYSDGYEVSEHTNPANAESVPGITQKIAVGLGNVPADDAAVIVFGAQAAGFEYGPVTQLYIDWYTYNELNGEARIATGDIDGDLKDEIIVGLGPVDGEPAIPGGWFQVLDHDYSHLAWGRISWTEYNEINGETRPACGDVDGDGRDEILVGLGRHGEGKVEVFDFKAGSLRHKAWLQVDWEEYNSTWGETRPACGNLDFDAPDEIIIGLGPVDDEPDMPGGRFQILDHDYSHLAWGRIDRSEYNSLNGETWPACGDVDMDARDEIIVGLGKNGRGGVELLDFLVRSRKAVHKTWLQAGTDAGITRRSETRPACGNLDEDVKDEIIIGLNANDKGQVVVFDDSCYGMSRCIAAFPLSASGGSIMDGQASQPAVIGTHPPGTWLKTFLEYLVHGTTGRQN